MRRAGQGLWQFLGQATAAEAAYHGQQQVEPLPEPSIVQGGLHRGGRLLNLRRRSAWQLNG